MKKLQVLTTSNSGSLFSIAAAMAANLLLCTTSAYAQGGIEIWTNRYDTQLNYQPSPHIAVDSSGNVLVMGYSRNETVSGSQADCVTIAYSNLGVPRWTNHFPIPNGGNVNLAVDSA